MEKKTIQVPQDKMKDWFCDLIRGSQMSAVELESDMLTFTLATLLGEMTVILPAKAVGKLLAVGSPEGK